MSNINETNETETNQNTDSLNTSNSKSYQTLSPKDITMMFENILPSHTEEERELLENNILKDGEIRDPLLIWKDGNKNTLIDGRLRHEIAQKHKLVCPVIYKEFTSTEEATLYVLDNQLGRRNLSDFSSCELVLHFEHIYKAQGRNHQSEGGKGCKISDKDKVDTKNILAKKADVSHDTLGKVKAILKSNPDTQTLTELRQGKLKINNVHSKLTGKKNPEPIETCLFNDLGGFVPELSSLKSVKIIPTKDGKFRVEVVTKENQKQVYETSNQIQITEIKPESTPSDSLPDVPAEKVDNSIQETVVETPEVKEESTITPTTPDEKLLHITYQEYDFDTITNPLWEDIRTMFIKDVQRMLKLFQLESGESIDYPDFEHDNPSRYSLEDLRTMFIKVIRKRFKYFSLKMDEGCEYPKFCEKLRLELVKNLEEKNQPLGGCRKTQSQIISELKQFKDLDPSSILISDDFGDKTLLKTNCRLTSGINQYFHEMMDTPTQSGKSPMDVIKNSETFMKFMERVIVADGMHLFTKSIEYKNNLKKAA